MTAFLELLNTYAIFFYIAGVLAVLFGIKMLFDARRSARTTLFTLEQEQASDRAFRAVLVMLGATLFIAAVAGINAFVAPIVPSQDPDIPEPTLVAFTPPVQLETPTPQPTLTSPPPTAGSETAAAPTAVANGGTVAPTQPAQPPAATEVPLPTATPEPPTAEPQPTSQFIYMAPSLNVPPNGDSIGSDNVRMSWGVDEFGNLSIPGSLPQDQFFRVVITYTDRTSNTTAARVICSHENSIDRRTGVDVTDYRTEAVDSLFQWTVTIVQSPSQEACQAGEFTPLSPTSAPSSFRLP